MDNLSYAEGAAALLNADLAEVDGLAAYLTGRGWLPERATDRDRMLLRRFQRELRPVFEAGEESRGPDVVAGLNDLLAHHPVVPRIAGDDLGRLHLHVADDHSSLAPALIAESLLGLATLVCDLGPDRLGVCSAAPCTDVYVDISPNHSRRYCSERCSSRANVAAYRARQRGVAGA